MINIMYLIEKRNAQGTASAVRGEAKDPVREHDCQSKGWLFAALDNHDFPACEGTEIEENLGVRRMPECKRPERQPSL